MTLKEIEKKICEVLETIHGNGSKGLKSEVEVMKNNLRYIWALLILTLSVNGVILGVVLKIALGE